MSTRRTKAWSEQQTRQDEQGPHTFCDQCQARVHEVRSRAEFDAAMAEGKCVWFDVHHDDRHERMFGGLPTPHYQPAPTLIWKD